MPSETTSGVDEGLEDFGSDTDISPSYLLSQVLDAKTKQELVSPSGTPTNQFYTGQQMKRAREMVQRPGAYVFHAGASASISPMLYGDSVS